MRYLFSYRHGGGTYLRSGVFLFRVFYLQEVEKDKVGEEYLAYVESRRNNNESIADGVK